MDLDQYLGKYPYENMKKWVSLTSYVTESIMQRIEPVSKKISSVTEVAQESFVTSQEKTSNESSQLSLSDKTEKISFDSAMRFTPLLLRQFPSGASPTEITKMCMDKSNVLEDILRNFTGLYFTPMYTVFFSFLIFFLSWFLAQEVLSILPNANFYLF